MPVVVKEGIRSMKWSKLIMFIGGVMFGWGLPTAWDIHPYIAVSLVGLFLVSIGFSIFVEEE
jgi:hypothetical protein